MPPFIPWRRRFGAKRKSRRFAGRNATRGPAIVISRIVAIPATRREPSAADDSSDEENEPQIFTHTKYDKRCGVCEQKFKSDHWLKKLPCDHVFHLKCANQKERCVKCFPPVVELPAAVPPPPPPTTETATATTVMPVSFPSDKELEREREERRTQQKEEAYAAARTEEGPSSEESSSSSSEEDSPDDGSQIFTHTKYDAQCSICLKRYKVGHWLKKLSCAHVFHLSCIDAWLPISNKCPLCRNETQDEGGGAGV